CPSRERLRPPVQLADPIPECVDSKESADHDARRYVIWRSPSQSTLSCDNFPSPVIVRSSSSKVNFVRCENRSLGDANELAGESRSIAISHPSSITFTS